jgi:hypothetical protein
MTRVMWNIVDNTGAILFTVASEDAARAFVAAAGLSAGLSVVPSYERD